MCEFITTALAALTSGGGAAAASGTAATTAAASTAASLQTASLVMTGLGAVTSAYGAYAQGQAQGAAMDAQAKIYEAQAADSQRRAAREERLMREQGSRIKGRQRAVLGASGVNLSTGSPMDTIADTQRSIEMDAWTIRENAGRESWGYQSQASISKAGASNARQAGYFGAGSNLLTGAGMVADKWYAYKYGV